MKSFFKKIIYIGLWLLFLSCLIYIFKHNYDVYSSQKEHLILNNILLSENELTPQNNIALSKEKTTQPEKTERMRKLENLQKQNSDIVAWIQIKGTNINYPVVQGSDNSYYLNHNYLKKYSVNGAIFLDKSYQWNPPNSNLLIYGHHSTFKSLLNYQKKNFYVQHPTIRFTTVQEDANYEIIAVFRSKVYYQSQKNVFRYYYFINAKNEEEYNNFIQNSKKAALYDTGKTAHYGEQLITLSTCSYHTKDGRFVVVAKKINEQ